MLSIFAIPKAFIGHIETIQANAIASWIRLDPPCDVTLFGDEVGVARYANEFGIRHVPSVAVNEFGTPLLNDVFRLAQAGAKHRTMCYVNADIILPSTFTRTAARIPFERFLMLGQRVDVDVSGRIDFSTKMAGEAIDHQLMERGVLHPLLGSDYFVFPKGSIGTLPTFAVGRPGWDNWMIFHALRHGVPVVNASAAVLAIHQNHDYAHVFGGSGRTYNGPEGDRNRSLIGSPDRFLTPSDSTWIMTPDQLRPAPWSLERSGRRLKAAGTDHPVLGFALRRAGTILERVGRRLRRTTGA